MTKQRNKKIKRALIEQLKRTPTIELACEKAGAARSSVYRWMKTNKKFAKDIDEALIEGRIFISDIAESQVFSLIKDKKFEAIRFWLTSNHPRYSNKLEINGNFNHSTGELTPEQEKLLREALILALPQKYDDSKNQNIPREDNGVDDKK